MQVVLEKQSGQFNAKYLELMGMLEDGKYLISVRSLNIQKTEREFQNEYFALVDIVRDYLGDTRYIIHDRFKKERNIETTKDFSLQDWIDFIEAFKWSQFKEHDLVL